VFLIGEENYINLAHDDCSWIVDWGASSHVTPHGNYFSSYQNGDFGIVKMRNQVSSKIVGIGDIAMTTNTGCKLVLKDVSHVLEMRLNLISTRKFDDVGLVNHFGGGKWKLTNDSLIVAKGVKEGSLYVMQGNLYKGEVNIVHDNSNLELRLRHISEKGLQIHTCKKTHP